MKTHNVFRKALSLILSLAFVFGMVVLPNLVSAGPPPYDPATISLSHAEGQPGEDVTINLDFTANSGNAAFECLIKFDSTKLAYKSYSLPPVSVLDFRDFSAVNYHYPPIGDTQRMFFNFVSTIGAEDAGTYLTVTFTILEGWSGTIPVELEVMMSYSSTYDELEFTSVDGSVTIPEIPEEYEITFDANGGLGGTTLTVEEGETPVAPEVTREGYDFLGWEPEVAPATEDTTYVAQWAIKTYEIEFDANGGTGSETKTVNHGDTPVAPAVSRKGYSFDRWEPTIVAATGDATYTAQWTKDAAAQISLSKETGERDDTVTVELSIINSAGLSAGDFLISFDNSKLEFVGYEPGGLLADGGILSAHADAGDLNVSFAKDGGLAAGSTVLAELKFKIIGIWNEETPLEFAEQELWDDDLDEFDNYTTEDGSVTCTTPLQSTITFDTDGGSVVDPITGDIGSEVEAPADPHKEGYTFEGWDPALPEVFPADDMTVTAVWEEKAPVYIVLSDETGEMGDEVTVDITVDEDSGISAATFEVYFDSSKLEYVGGAKGDLTAAALFSANESGDGEIRVAFATGESIAAQGILASLTFKIIGKWTGSTPVELEVEDLYDSHLDALESEVEAGSVTCTTPITYEITFVLDNGEDDEVLTVVEGEMPEIDDPVKEGYTFQGWEPDLAVATEDASYTAQWELNVYNITFVLDNGEDDVVVATNHGAMPEVPADPEKEGYTFLGWAPEVVEATEDATYTAQWELNVYDITFDFDNGEDDVVVATNHGAMPEVPADPEKEGYTFLGWAPEVVEATEDATYTAQWKLNVYDITFVFDNGEDDLVVETDHGAMPEAPADPEKEGYTFLGWDPELAEATEDATYTAKWKVKTYTITFVANGGDLVSGDLVQTVNHNDTPEAPVLNRDGYEFAGWEPELTNATEDVTYYAQWKAIPEVYSTITFDTDGGNAIDPIGGVVGTTVPAVEIPVKEGFEFVGWEPALPEVFPEDDVTLVAQWKPLVIEPTYYTITFIASGGTPSMTEVIVEEGQVPVAPEVTREGYVLLGWAPVGTTEPIELPPATADAQYRAIWGTASYEITFVLDNGEDDVVINVDHGDTPAIDAPVREGYIFQGWEPAIAVATKDATYTAQWEINVYDITFVLDNGEDDVVVETDHGAMPEAPTDPEKEGYTFLGWEPTLVEATGEATYTAQWELNVYDITFVLDNGEDDVVVKTNHGAMPEAPTDPEKEGYTFLGWEPEVVEATGEATYTAQWELNVYDITFVLDNGEDDVVVKTNHGAMPEAPTDPEKEGYTFLGWEPELTEATEDATYTAQWEEVVEPTVYTITFVLDNGDADVVLEVEEGDMPVEPTGFTKDGFTFLGWEPAIAVATEDATYTALWEEDVEPEDPTIRLTYKGEDAGEELCVKVPWCWCYSRQTLQLGYETNVEGGRVEFVSTNNKVLVDNNGKVTNRGCFSRTSVIMVKVYDADGNVLASDSVKVTFYKNIIEVILGWSLRGALESAKGFQAIMKWFNGLGA